MNKKYIKYLMLCFCITTMGYAEPVRVDENNLNEFLTKYNFKESNRVLYQIRNNKVIKTDTSTLVHVDLSDINMENVNSQIKTLSDIIQGGARLDEITYYAKSSGYTDSEGPWGGHMNNNNKLKSDIITYYYTQNDLIKLVQQYDMLLQIKDYYDTISQKHDVLEKYKNIMFVDNYTYKMYNINDILNIDSISNSDLIKKYYRLHTDQDVEDLRSRVRELNLTTKDKEDMVDIDNKWQNISELTTLRGSSGSLSYNNIDERTFESFEKYVDIRDESVNEDLIRNTVTGNYNELYANNSSITGNLNNVGDVENYHITGNSNVMDKGENSIIMGNKNKTYGNNNTILGNSNKIGDENNTSTNNILLGSNITVPHTVNNAIVIGDGSTPMSNDVSIGSIGHERKIHFVKDGEISETSKEAVNGSQLFAIAKGNSVDIDVEMWRNKLGIGDTSRDINESTNARLTLVNDNVNALGDKLEKFALKEELREKSTNAAIANIAAMSQIPQVSGDKLFSLGAGTAYHKGEFAGSVGISGQDTRKRFVYKLSGALNSKKEFTVGAGFNFNLGQINEPSVVKDDILDGKLKDIITKNNKNLEDKDSRILKLESELDKLRHENSDKFNNVLKDIQNLKDNQATRQHRIVLDGFEVNKYNLSDKHLNILKNLVHSGLGGKITIIGYTDTVGKERPNLDLGLNRAKEVARFLASKGATIKYIRSGGYNQIVTASNIEGFKNRRVEIIVEY